MILINLFTKSCHNHFRKESPSLTVHTVLNVLLVTLEPLFYKKGVPKHFTKFTGKHLCLSIFFNKVAGLSPATLLKKDSDTGAFLWILHLFYKQPLDNCFWNMINQCDQSIVHSCQWLFKALSTIRYFFLEGGQFNHPSPHPLYFKKNLSNVNITLHNC